MPEQRLIILGASARAACFSAHRSAYSPYWIDQYGDHDLTQNFIGSCIPADKYPDGILDQIAASPTAPFLYTGALENHLQVLEELEKHRSLLGNSAEVCRVVRDPEAVSACFKRADIKHPELSSLPLASDLTDRQWLIKPLRSAGGLGVMHHNGDENVLFENQYLQEFISGENRAGVFLGNGKSVSLLGVTRQLVGETFLHAGEFSYCGSIGPLQLDDNEHQQWLHIGSALTAEFGLRGLFGVDAISRNGELYPLEINPRYTASVEVLELALEIPVIAMHCDACHGKLPSALLPVANSLIGKAYLFAAQTIVSPANVEQLYDASDSFPRSADIPHAHTVINQGHPVMTILTGASSVDEAMQALKNRAELLYSKFNII